MKYSKVNICIIFAVFLFCTCSSTKKASSAQASATQVSSSSSSDVSNNKFPAKGQITTVTGTLDMYSAGKYPYFINKGSGKNITTYFLQPDKEHEDVYYSLYSCFKHKIQIKGYEISRKSSWNITLAVTEVTIIE
ncbi:MAG: hypothetical protein PUC37_01985 [Spirochaetales bacterium]|nr:hypothetical protein [Spirochaetales bacterium]